MKFISKNLNQTEEIAKSFLEKIALEFSDRAIVVGLYGDLGSGKTTFTQAIAKILNIKEYVTSPTFVIEKRYDIEHPLFKKIIHIDAYRLDSGKELLAIDWERDIKDPRNLILVEWPERILEVMPEKHSKINFKFLSENEREIEI
jgi:tRNA threonylcarbamoyladenosine biosynthesis protein TsaE